MGLFTGSIKAASKFNAFLRKWYRLVSFFLFMQITGVFWYAIGKGGNVTQAIRESNQQAQKLTAAILELNKTQKHLQIIYTQINQNDSIQNGQIKELFTQIKGIKSQIK